MRMLIFGHGYTAAALTPRLTADGWQVSGTTRERAADVAATGARAILWPGEPDRVRAEIARADAVLVGIAPGDDDPVLSAFANDLAGADLRWLGYLSTTGVYGDRDGGWVSEKDPCTPTTRRGEARLVAERAWQDFARCSGHPLHIFRLAGIYGPGRGPFSKLRRGTARRIIKPNQVFSRIHVEDIAQVLMASIRAPSPGAVYNVCDDEPAPPEDVIEYAARLTGLPVPPAEDWDSAAMTPMARSFYAESKRVANDRIKSDLRVRLRYPDYRVGLEALYADGAKTS